MGSVEHLTHARVSRRLHGAVRGSLTCVDGDWIPSRVAMVVRPSRAVRVYEVGDKVEVVRNRDVYGDSWFLATVRVVVDNLSYVVEYFDLEEGEGGLEKATEYLHWRFIRPAFEHTPGEGEFQLQPGAAVEACCDGAWSPGVLHRVDGQGEYDISIVGKKAELLVTKVVELLKPRYKWNGNQWRIALLRYTDLSSRGDSSDHNNETEIPENLDDKIQPLVKPTRAIINFRGLQYAWHDFVSKNNHNAITILCLWAPVVSVVLLWPVSTRPPTASR